MRQRLINSWQRYPKIIALAVGLPGLAFFLVQAWSLAARLPAAGSGEGIYLYKGYLFASGRYQPFEDFGPITDQLPVSYLIPGYVQAQFGPGMETARMYAMVVGALALLGVFLTVYRNASAWWAAAAVWAAALNPAYVQAFSQAIPQTLVSMLFAWMLFFGLGRERRNWELGLAAFLAGLAGMAWVNVLPALLLFVAYVFWQYGQRSGWTALIAGVLPVIGLHALYWPEILKFWAEWIPEGVFAEILDYRSPWRKAFLPEDFSWFPVSRWINDREHLAWVGVSSIGQALRVNFVVFLGVILSVVFWPWRRHDYQRDRAWGFSRRDQFIYLLVSFVVLFGIHLWAANGQQCQFTCLPEYVMFFFVFGLVLVPISAVSWRLEKPILLLLLVLILTAALLLAFEYNYASDYLEFRFELVRGTLDAYPWQFDGGWLERSDRMLWEMLQDWFGFDHSALRRFILSSETAVHLVRWIKVLGLVGIVAPLAYWLWRKLDLPEVNFASFALLLILAFGILTGRSGLFGGQLTAEPCQESVIDSYQQVGAALNDLIPPDSQIYWGVESGMLLLYLPEAEVFPPQLDGAAAYIDDPDADTELLRRFGWWNSELKEEWLQQADYILVENRWFDKEWQARLDAGQLDQVYLSEPAASCRGDASRIVVLIPAEAEASP